MALEFETKLLEALKPHEETLLKLSKLFLGLGPNCKGLSEQLDVFSHCVSNFLFTDGKTFTLDAKAGTVDIA